MKMNITQKKQRKALDIGVKTTAKTLKKWANKNVDFSTTTDTVSLSESTDIIDAPNDYIILYTEIVSNNYPGLSLIIMNKKDALVLIDLLRRKKIGSTKKIDKIGKSALIETTNLLSGSYLNALSRLCNVSLVSSIPELVSIKKVRRIINYIAKSRKGKGVIFVNELIVKPYKIKIDLFLLFGGKLLQTLVKK